MNRQHLLETAFSDIPSKVGDITLRPLSASSFTLLSRLGNPMMVGNKKPAAALEKSGEQGEMFAAVIQYLWVHSAPLETIVEIERIDQIPEREIKMLGYGVTMGEALKFIAAYQESALRMTASLAEVEPEEDTGKPGKLPETRHAGSHRSFSPAEQPETPSGSDTSSGSCPSSEHSPTSTPPTSPAEPAAAGLVILPDLTPETPEETPRS